MKSEDIVALHKKYVMSTYAPSIPLVRGQGARVWDADGREYLDFLGGIATISVGHCHPRLVAAIRNQAGTLMHVSNLFYNENQPQLAQALVARAGLGEGAKCFFCNSGAEANEGLIKLARFWGHARGKFGIVSMRNSFHGRTLAALTATGQTKYQKGFEPLPAGFAYADFNNLESVRAAVTAQTAAILVEAVQGEGGVLPADPAFLKGLQALCAEKELLLFFDEVQCGLGRTGHWFGFQASGVVPDGFSLAKGLGGGFPIGAIVAGPRISNLFQPGNHASTFGGTPLAAAAALAVVDIVTQERLVENSALRGRQLMAELEKIAAHHNWITGVRGAGLMLGLVLNHPAKDFEQALMKEGLITLATAGNVIRIVPPLNITAADVQQAVDIIGRVASAYRPALPA